MTEQTKVLLTVLVTVFGMLLGSGLGYLLGKEVNRKDDYQDMWARAEYFMNLPSGGSTELTGDVKRAMSEFSAKREAVMGLVSELGGITDTFKKFLLDVSGAKKDLTPEWDAKYDAYQKKIRELRTKFYSY